MEGKFSWPRLARLSNDDQHLVELIILTSGSLKEVAKRLDVSYPTIRKRFDSLIKSLEAEIESDQKKRDAILKDVEAGKRSAGDAAREIDSI